MSIKVMTRVWDHSQQKGSKLLILLALADHCDDTGVCWPGIERLAKKARISPRQVQYHLRDLESEGEIFIKAQTGRTNTNRYFVIAGLTRDSIHERLVKHDELRFPPEEAKDILVNIFGKDEADCAISQDEKGCNPAPERVQSSAEKGCNPAPERVQSIAPEPSWNGHENHHEPAELGDLVPSGTQQQERQRKIFGNDPVEGALLAWKRLGEPDNRPAGWRDAGDDEYEICRRVADLWTGGVLPWSADDIEKNLSAAHQILQQHGGDKRAAIRTIDHYHAEKGDDLVIAGPYSLRNVLPQFMNQRNGRQHVRISVK